MLQYKLMGIFNVLPGTSTTNAGMAADRTGAGRVGLVEVFDFAGQVIMPAVCDFHIGGFARNGPVYKNTPALEAAVGFARRMQSRNGQAGGQSFFSRTSSHAGKSTKMQASGDSGHASKLLPDRLVFKVNYLGKDLSEPDYVSL